MLDSQQGSSIGLPNNYLYGIALAGANSYVRSGISDSGPALTWSVSSNPDGGGSSLSDGTAAAGANVVDVKAMGAIGDCASHPLSSKYATLAAAQAVYPLATSLTQEIDLMAINKAIAEGASVYAPAGTYLITGITRNRT